MEYVARDRGRVLHREQGASIMAHGYEVFPGNVHVKAMDLRVGCQTFRLRFRIDGREKSKIGGYRVDLDTGLGPWEAIDGGIPYGTLGASKAFVRRWVLTAVATQTLTPNMTGQYEPRELKK